MIAVEVSYASPHRQLLEVVQVAEEATVEQAIVSSTILTQFPEIDLATAKVGIFSRVVGLSEKLQTGDRIEIYRPLLIDPKQARLLRAKRARKK